MSKADRIAYWRESARMDKKTAKTLYESKDYHWSLFFWQLVLEKLIKAVLLIRKKEPKFTHNLLILVRQADIPLTSKQEKEFQEITSFNLEARYDDEKFSFYKKATKAYADTWIAICQSNADQWEKLI